MKNKSPGYQTVEVTRKVLLTNGDNVVEFGNWMPAEHGGSTDGTRLLWRLKEFEGDKDLMLQIANIARNDD